MARYTDAVCRLCRREGMKLFLKGTKCFSDKCPIEKRNFAPGQHGKDRKAKIVGYGLQLREKQKAKRIYFTQEGQFRNYFEKARPHQGRHRRNAAAAAGAPPGQRRLPPGLCDVAPPGAPVGAPRPRRTSTAARSTFLRIQVSVGEEIAIREGSKKLPMLELAKEFASHQNAPTWLEIDRDNYKGRVLCAAEARRHPAAGQRAADRRAVQQVVASRRSSVARQCFAGD